MFSHIFRYSFKTLFKNKSLIFWTFMFPIILGTLFNMAFSSIEDEEKLDVINIAVVENEGYVNNNLVVSSFKSLSEEGDNQLFNTKFVGLDEASKMLDDEEIIGYLVIGEDSKIVINTNGIDQTIFKYASEEILDGIKVYSTLEQYMVSEYIHESGDLYSTDMELIYKEVYEKINEKLDNLDIKVNDNSSNNLSYILIEFYTLIAMTCLYSGILSMHSINNVLANMSSKGMRVAVSPVSKMKLVFGSLLASYVTQLIGLILLFAYTIFVLGIDYGGSFGYIVLLSFFGSLAGLSLGLFVSSVFKVGENLKLGIILAIAMFGCFLSGMMGVTMKYVIDKNVPFVNVLNPANMITDGFYALYYYDNTSRFSFNVYSLVIFSVILIGVSVFSLRRQRYDSI